MIYLLDTNVISELVKKSPDQRVVNWIDSMADESLALSVITIGEIRKGVEKIPDSTRRLVLDRWLNEELLVRFSGRIVPLDVPVMLTWGRMQGRFEAEGRKLPAIDSLIAAQVVHHHLKLATRNVKDFSDCGVDIFNPWDDLSSSRSDYS